MWAFRRLKGAPPAQIDLHMHLVCQSQIDRPFPPFTSADAASRAPVARILAGSPPLIKEIVELPAFDLLLFQREVLILGVRRGQVAAAATAVA